MRKIIWSIFLFLLSISLNAQEVVNCEEKVEVAPELAFLFEGSAPVINYVNECQERFGLSQDKIVDPMVLDHGMPKALYDHPLECLKSFFKGLKESATDLLGALWDLVKAFAKTINKSVWALYDFFKAAFTGNLSYWFMEASNDAGEFARSFIDSIKAIPSAVANFFQGKSDEWECLNDKGKVGFSCHIAGYLGGDVLAGVLTAGYSKLALATKIKSVSSKFIKAKKAPRSGLAQGSRKRLGELIPAHKRDSRFIVEVDDKGHYSVRYFDKEGNAKIFDGSPFYHLVNGRQRRQGIGTHRVRTKSALAKGEHFSIDVSPEKFQKLMDYIDDKKGSISIACTRTACESMKAAGVDLGQSPVPSMQALYKGLVDEAGKDMGAVTQVGDKISEAQRAAKIEAFAKGTNLVRLQFGVTALSGVIYTPAIAGAPIQFAIDTMEEHRLPEQSEN